MAGPPGAVVEVVDQGLQVALDAGVETLVEPEGVAEHDVEAAAGGVEVHGVAAVGPWSFKEGRRDGLAGDADGHVQPRQLRLGRLDEGLVLEVHRPGVEFDGRGEPVAARDGPRETLALGDDLIERRQAGLVADGGGLGEVLEAARVVDGRVVDANPGRDCLVRQRRVVDVGHDGRVGVLDAAAGVDPSLVGVQVVLVVLVDDRAAEDFVLGVRLHVVARHDAEVVAPALEPPIEVGIGVLVDLKDLTLARDQFVVQHVVRRPAVFVA